jgi:hypothetical protein
LVRQPEPKSETVSVCPNRTDIGGKPKTFFFSPSSGKMKPGTPGGESGVGEEEIKDHVEMEEDSTSTVPMLPIHGTFIGGTVDGTVNEDTHSTKHHIATENMSEDIQDYG